MDSLGSRIKFIRNVFKLSQKDFADRLYVTASYISKVEKGTEIPSDMFIKLLSYEFNHEFEWIKTGVYSNPNVISKEGVLQYYDSKIKMLYFEVNQLNISSINDVVDMIESLRDLLDTSFLNEKNESEFTTVLNNLIRLIDEMVTYISVNGSHIKRDYHKLLLFKNYFDKTSVTINEHIKSLLNCYIKQYEMDIELWCIKINILYITIKLNIF